MIRETYPCKCGGTLSFVYKTNRGFGAWQCDSCNLETTHVRIDDKGNLHKNTFLPEYGARKRIRNEVSNGEIQ